MRDRPSAKGYPRVGLPSGDYPVHRVIAKLFIHNDDPENKTQVNHINGKKSDNSASNLEWVTPSENLKHAYKLGLISRKGESNTNARLTRHDVDNIRNSDKTTAELAELYGVTRTHIRRIITFKVWNDKAL